MESADIQRRELTISLRDDLIGDIKNAAQRQNCSINDFLEGVLLDYFYNEPNEVTKAAIEEAMNRKDYSENKVYDNVDKLFEDILNEE